jgi:hypothetical protein
MTRIGTDVEDANESVIGEAPESSEPEHVEEGGGSGERRRAMISAGYAFISRIIF